AKPEEELPAGAAQGPEELILADAAHADRSVLLGPRISLQIGTEVNRAGRDTPLLHGEQVGQGRAGDDLVTQFAPERVRRVQLHGLGDLVEAAKVLPRSAALAVAARLRQVHTNLDLVLTQSQRLLGALGALLACDGLVALGAQEQTQ